jgi:hypothetical protein
MISKTLIEMIKRSLDRLTKHWCQEITKSEFMKTYQQYNDDELIKRNKKFFENLTKWIEEGTSRQEIGAYFVDIGKKRYREKFPLCELNYAVFLGKKVFRDIILNEAILNSALECHQAIGLITMIDKFFDLGNFYLIRGYLEEMYSTMVDSKKLSDEDIKKYFFHGSFFKLDALFS